MGHVEKILGRIDEACKELSDYLTNHPEMLEEKFKDLEPLVYHVIRDVPEELERLTERHSCYMEHCRTGFHRNIEGGEKDEHGNYKFLKSGASVMCIISVMPPISTSE